MESPSTEVDRGPSGVPGPLAALAARVGHGPDAAQVAGAIAACRIAHRVGTPLADVLERCASGIVESAEAASARRTALAGPRSTARLLAWLPLAGVLLGTGLGADPLGVLLGGGIGGWCLVLGVGLVVAGRRWVATLVRRAERAGGS
ncbi:type II secretion protein F [Ruania sp. N2-46]|uniref:Type II secretion protein F n=2 Tax=Occultella gossypii TaxID=2800820 RepID=A0ABS7SC67_9MICO|nr:type II secretion protein F [Occultella gossypii]